MSSCWVIVVVVLLVAQCFVGPRATRARQTHPQILTNFARARARGASPHICEKEVREPTNTAKTMVWTMFLQQARKQKLKIRIAKKQKHRILRCFWPAGCQTSRSEKCLKHRCLQCFVFPPKTKQRYVRCFLTLGTPK